MPLKVSEMKVVPIRQERKPKKWLTQKEAAEYLGLSISTVSNKSRRDNDPIPYRKLDGKVQYDFKLLQQWEERNSISNYEEG